VLMLTTQAIHTITFGHKYSQFKRVLRIMLTGNTIKNTVQLLIMFRSR